MIPKEIDSVEFSKLVFKDSKNPSNLWRQKRNKTGKYRFTEKDIQKITEQLLILAEKIKAFAEKIVIENR
jgi:hypothetical protein